MNFKQKELRLVISAGEYNNNPGCMHTQEDELILLDENTRESSFNRSSLIAILAEHV